MNKHVLIWTLGWVLFSSCSPRLTPFTQKFYDSYEFKQEDLKRIQFYLSEDVVLRRDMTGGNVEIVQGEIKVVDGRKVEQIVIRKGTPGVLVTLPKENRFAVSFEPDDDTKFLMFGPNEKLGRKYTLLAADWKKHTGVISYGDQKYYTDGHNGLAALMVNLNKMYHEQRKSHVAKGRTVGS